MTPHPRLRAIATAVPEQVVQQNDAQAVATLLFGKALGRDAERLLSVFGNTGIRERHVCMPLEWYEQPHDFGETNTLYIEHGTALCARAIEGVCASSGLDTSDIDRIIFVSSTGISNPSLDARLTNALGFRSDVRRVPVWGLGCAGGAAGVTLASDFARAYPHERVLLVALELCSLTFQHRDRTRQNLVASALFADGAAAVLVTGTDAPQLPLAVPGPFEILGSHSTQMRDSLDVMGWDIDQHGLHVIFSRDIPTIVRDWVRPALDGFLETGGRVVSDLHHLAAHPGGPRVLNAYAEALAFPAERLRHSREVLESYGNMSSPTCLFVLQRMLENGVLAPHDLTLLTALGPGFASEMVLLRRVAG